MPALPEALGPLDYLLWEHPRLYDDREETSVATIEMVKTVSQRVTATDRAAMKTTLETAAPASADNINAIPRYTASSVQRLALAVAVTHKRAVQRAGQINDTRRYYCHDDHDDDADVETDVDEFDLDADGLQGSTHTPVHLQPQTWLPLAIFFDHIDDDCGLAAFAYALVSDPAVLQLTTFEQASMFNGVHPELDGSRCSQPGVYLIVLQGKEGHPDRAFTGVAIEQGIDEHIAEYARVFDDRHNSWQRQVFGITPPSANTSAFVALVLFQLPIEQPARYLRLLLEAFIGDEYYEMGEDIICPLVLAFMRIVLQITLRTIRWPGSGGIDAIQLDRIAWCLVSSNWQGDNCNDSAMTGTIVALRKRQALTRSMSRQTLADMMQDGGLPAVVRRVDGHFRLDLELDKGDRHHDLPLGTVGFLVGDATLVLRSDDDVRSLPAIRTGTADDAFANDLLSTHNIYVKAIDRERNLATLWAGREIPVKWSRLIASLASYLKDSEKTPPAAESRTSTHTLGDARLDGMAALLLSEIGLPLKIIAHSEAATVAEVPVTHVETTDWLARRRQNIGASSSTADFVEWNMPVGAPVGSNKYALLKANKSIETLMAAWRGAGDLRAASQRSEWRTIYYKGRGDMHTVLLNLARVAVGKTRLAGLSRRHGEEPRDDDNNETPPLLRVPPAQELSHLK